MFKFNPVEHKINICKEIEKIYYFKHSENVDEDDKEISLLESFNYYLKKDQINDKSLDIDDLKITKYLNEIIELRNTLC
ncbi:13160_t:CDS:1, partial [Dentiscutata erythropus]